MYLKEIIELLSVKGLGMQTFHKLIERYGDLPTLLETINRGTLYDETKMKVTQDIGNKMASFDLIPYITSLKKEDVKVVTVFEEMYPQCLKSLTNYPPILHYKGDLSIVNENPLGIAVVGSRKISSYGQRVAYDIGRYLGRYQVPVVSGLAYGVDYEVHRGVLSVGGLVVAVVANGLETVYPREHKALAKEIENKGVIVTEEFLYSELSAYKFPIRNRLISGLASTIVVVEAEERSGSLTTALHGLEQGKNVFAVPGSIYSSTSKGTNRLIAEGAIPLTNFEQLVEGYEKILSVNESKGKAINDTNDDNKQLDNRIVSLLSSTNELSIDDLSIQLKVETRYVAIEVMKLEIKGIIRGIIGNKYTLL